LNMLTEDGVFPIVPSYLRLAAQGQKILGFRADDYYWLDLGKPQNVKKATEDLRRGVIVQ
jgi:NDP-sugar pyrophosphorylase family protein